MYVPSNTPKYVCYRCRNKIPIVDLEAVFHEQLKTFFFSPDEIARNLQEADSVIKEREALLSVLEDEQRKLEQEIDKLYDLYLAGEIPKEGFGKKYRPLEERFKQLDDQIPALQGEVDFLKIQYLSSDEIVSEAQDLYTRWPELTNEEKRRIVETITDSIIVAADGEITINLCYLPPRGSVEFMANEQRDFRDSWPRLIESRRGIRPGGRPGRW